MSGLIARMAQTLGGGPDAAQRNPEWEDQWAADSISFHPGYAGWGTEPRNRSATMCGLEKNGLSDGS